MYKKLLQTILAIATSLALFIAPHATAMELVMPAKFAQCSERLVQYVSSRNLSNQKQPGQKKGIIPIGLGFAAFKHAYNFSRISKNQSIDFVLKKFQEPFVHTDRFNSAGNGTRKICHDLDDFFNALGVNCLDLPGSCSGPNTQWSGWSCEDQYPRSSQTLRHT